MKTIDKYELAARIGIFLVKRNINSYGYWSGKLTKKEQVEAFGYYFGKGSIHVDGLNETIGNNVKVCFGTDIVTVCEINCKDGSWYDNANTLRKQIENHNTCKSTQH